MALAKPSDHVSSRLMVNK